VLFQFYGQGEVGIGRGVEREVFESVSKALVDRNNPFGVLESCDAGGGSGAGTRSAGEVMTVEVPLPWNLSLASQGQRAGARAGSESGLGAGANARSGFTQTDLALEAVTPACHCRQAAALRTVTKVGANTGRRFWSCPKSMNDASRCGFFEWASASESSAVVVDGTKNHNQTINDNKSKITSTSSSSSYNIQRDSLYALGCLVGHLLLRKIAHAGQSRTVQQGSNTSTLWLLHQQEMTDLRSGGPPPTNHDRDSTNSSSAHRGGACLSINLPILLWKIILNPHRVVGLHDLQSFDGMLHQSLVFVAECDPDSLASLDLYFSAPAPPEGSGSNSNSSSSSSVVVNSSEIPLEPGGCSRNVDAGNRTEYLRLLVAHHVKTRLGPQAARIREGLLSVVPQLILGLFGEGDLSTLITGQPELSAEEWQAHTVIQTGLGGSSSLSSFFSGSAQVRWFWALVKEMSQQERGLLLRFCTGCSRLSAGGFAALSPRFSITLVSYAPERSLPTAATCFNLLKLPLYPDERSLRKSVTTAILYGSEGFAFS